MIIYTVLQYQPSQFTVDGKVKNTTTNLVSTYTNKFGNTGSAVSEYTYTYDTWGSITKIKDLAGRQRTYTYNKYGEITNASETYSDGTTTTYAYTYDDSGNIKTETIRNTKHEYKYDSVWKDKLTAYFYTRNMQGDVTAIYRNSDSKLIGTYEYDLWGKLVKVKEASTGIDTQGVLTKNPIRYRGYYYDTETKLYNLNARYYDPEVRRFISPDDVEYLGVGDSLTSYNLFAYCGNDPIMGYDPTGHWDWNDLCCSYGLCHGD